MLDNGTISMNYKSWFVSKGINFNDPMSTPIRFTHEIGSALAHRSAWEQIVQRSQAGDSTSWAAIFEDDALLRPDFESRVAELLKKLPSVTADLVLLGHCFEFCPKHPDPFVDIGGDAKLVQTRHGVCTHAYLISPKAARRMLSATIPLHDALDERFRAMANSHELKSWSVCPAIAKQPWQEFFVSKDATFKDYMAWSQGVTSYPKSEEFTKYQETLKEARDEYETFKQWLNDPASINVARKMTLPTPPPALGLTAKTPTTE